MGAGLGGGGSGDGIRRRVRREVEEELGFHLEMRTRELIRAGWDEDEARAEAERRLGDLEEVRARMRREGERREVGMERRRWWDEVRQDVGFALRQLRAAPGFTLVTVLTLALAIGANAGVFTVVNGVLLKPLPYDEPDELATLLTRYLPPSGFDLPRFPLSGPEYLDIREESQVFERTGAFLPQGSRTLTGQGEEAVRISVAFVSYDVFPVLGVEPALGRTLAPEEDLPDGPAAVVLGHDLWTSRFGEDPALVGRTITLNGEAHEVVGVMPADFSFGSDAQAWLPLGLDRSSAGGRAGHGYYGVGRLAEGRTMADAHAELELFADRWAQEYEHNVAHFAITEPLRDTLLGDAPGRLGLLLGAVALVLLVACVNVANLLLARGERRGAEVAVRVALGAGRGRILRQLLTESAVLGGLAALFGAALAWVGTPWLVSLAPSALPRLETVRPDGLILAVAAGVGLLTVALFGVGPAWIASGRAVRRAASAASKVVGGGSRRLRTGLVTLEVGVSVVVVLLAGLLVRSYQELSAVDRGMETRNLLTFSLTLPEHGYPEASQVPEEFGRILEQISGLPGVARATAGTILPFADGVAQWDFQLDDRPPRADGEQAWNAAVVMAMPGYLETLGIPLRRGRPIQATDGPGAPWVGVVNETFARTYWPDRSLDEVVGRRWGYQQTEDSTTWITVAGVAADPRRTDLDEEPYPQVWIPALQAGASSYFWPRSLRVAVRTGTDPASLTEPIRRLLADIDPDLPMYEVATMEAVVAERLARPRLTTSLLAFFGLLALLLAAVGVYGVVSYSVAGRTREMGVRRALGAGIGSVRSLVVREGLRPVLFGVAVGLLGAWGATRWVESLLFGVEPTDPLTFVLISAVFVGVGLLASWVPAVRATRVAPTVALRQE